MMQPISNKAASIRFCDGVSSRRTIFVQLNSKQHLALFAILNYLIKNGKIPKYLYKHFMKQKSPQCVSTDCMTHREALAFKRMSPGTL